MEDDDVRAAPANIFKSRHEVLLPVPIGLPGIADDPTYATYPERIEFGNLAVQ